MELRPCYECTRSGFEYRFLHGDMSRTEVHDFLYSLCEYGGASGRVPRHLMRLISQLANRKQQLVPGGLAVTSGSTTLYPGCCTGLENWRDWYDVRPGGRAPWLGHNPDTWIELCEQDVIVHADHEPGPHDIRADYRDVRVALDGAAQTMREALARIEAVAQETNPGMAAKFVSNIDRWLTITPRLDVAVGD